MARMKQEGRDVINLGVETRISPPRITFFRLYRRRWGTRNISLSQLLPHPAAEEVPSPPGYRRRFGVDLDPNNEVLPLLGSTDALFMVHLCLIDPETSVWFGSLLFLLPGVCTTAGGWWKKSPS